VETRIGPLAVVTGASAGIGEVFARKLAAQGYRLLLAARRRDRLEALAAEFPGRAEAFPADLASEAGVRALEERIAGDETLELLVNNAGFGTLGRFWELPVESQETMHRLHVMASVRLTHAALRGMARRNRGGVINVSSVAAFGHSPGNVSYCATKAWMNVFTSALDLELRAAGSAVKVQALCPGFTYSDFHDTMGVDRDKIPRALWLEADFVVEESLRAFDRGKVIAIPAWRYKAIAAFLRYLPRWVLRAGAIRYSRRTGRG
jgi:uncharacterized protein